MKKTIPIFIILFMLFQTSCWNDNFEFRDNYYSEYKPVLMKRDALENSVSFQEPRQLCRTGKIYFKDDIIYINEKYKGVHIIDNSNPSNPTNLGFISVPGSVDMAMKNNVIFIDNATDLIAIDLSAGITNPTVTKREKNVFPEHLPPDGLGLREEYIDGNRPENTVIIGWEKAE